MKFKICSLLLLVSLVGFGQVQSDAIKVSITNSRTSKHVNIPGTRLYIIPPPNFNVAKTFLGLQKGEQTLLTVLDLVGGNFYTNAATFDKETFERQGARVFDYREIKVNGYPARYLSLQGDATTKGYGLVFGDTTFSTMIMAIYPVTDEATGRQILAALNTIYYDKGKKVNPFETAFFLLDETKSKLKFFQYSANFYIYTLGGVDHTKSTDAPFLMVTQFPMDNSMTAKSIADLMIGKAQQYGLTNPEVKNMSSEKINGYDAYEGEVYGQMQGKSSVIYQCVVVKGDRVVTIQGIARDDMEANVQEFKKLAYTVRLK